MTTNTPGARSRIRHDTAVRLGRTPLTVTALGFGATAIGGMYTEVSDGDAEETVAAAWDAGLRYFDAAPQYGRGNGETRLGRGLARYRRDDYVLSSKVGRLLRADADPHPDDFDSTGQPYDAGAPDVATVYDYSRDGVLRSIEESLIRLGTDRLDVALVHDPDDYVDEALATALPTLIELRDQKVVSAIGAGMNQTAALERFARESDPDMFLLAGRYTLLEQTALQSFLPLCTERGIAVVTGGVFNSGLLANPGPQARYDYDPAPADVVARAHRLFEVCRRHDVPLKAAALQFPLAHPAVVAVLTGARSRAEIVENVELFDRPIPEELWSDLVSQGLLDESAPVGEPR
ncbi:aldo/keto reductase [Mycolicibacterium sp. 050158]|uniref:aldo/keto reductase n=1 Tax=Mycolicibacterium sp. 050158 TaxID=3090602 RepID=UPI00299E164C|nr:aldo/keto reductase [Mycolicibacterium sp. 050158]MDX1893060.1 aldo/keto reductase [Mycolicibacterium sp. 050158]